MAYKQIPLAQLLVNPSNDRHGELENETAAIAQLFASQETHMRSLAKDLVDMGEVFEPPLVFPDGDKYIVADGNRRTTCLKLLSNPRRAPTVELQQFFAELKNLWSGKFPEKIECRVENDRDRVDDILYRRHTGVQGGIGQSNWNDRMKTNFVVRTGKSTTLHLADEIEKRLSDAKMLPGRKIPRSNLNRLLSAESLRNRVGVSVRKGKLEFIRDEQATLNALQRIVTDLANRVVTLDNIWDTDAKLKYLDKLDGEGVLPSVTQTVIPAESPTLPTTVVLPTLRPISSKLAVHANLIPQVEYGIVWTANLQRHHEIWEELQFKLKLMEHPNAIAVLLRVLLELSIDNYVKRLALSSVYENDKLARKAAKVADDMQSNGKIDGKYHGAITKLQQGDEMISVDTLNRYVHSPNFRVSPAHLTMLWGTLAEFIVICLTS